MAPSAYVQELNKPTSTSNPMSSIALVYFSPTGNSKKAVSSIGELPCVTVKTFDITGNVEVPETDLSGFDFVVFGAPVYAGRIPACSVDRFKKMKGSGTPCALVLTYGNRAYEDAPRELGDIAEANGFRIKGVATMASQHTYGQIQLGRPNKDDIAELQEFYFHMLAKAEEPETVIPPQNSLVDGVQLTFKMNGRIFNSAQVGQMCEFKYGPAIMTSTGPTSTRIQPNNPYGCKR